MLEAEWVELVDRGDERTIMADVEIALVDQGNGQGLFVDRCWMNGRDDIIVDHSWVVRTNQVAIARSRLGATIACGNRSLLCQATCLSDFEPAYAAFMSLIATDSSVFTCTTMADTALQMPLCLMFLLLLR